MTVLYDRRSGMTHIVASPVPEILMAIGESGKFAEIAERLQAEGDGDVLAERLDELVATGLIERS